MKKFPLLSAIVLASSTAVASTAAFADDGAAASEAYVRDHTNKVVRDHRGKCWRTSAWSEETATKECDPQLFPEEAAVATEIVYESATLSTNALFDFDDATLKSEGMGALQALGDSIRSKGAQVVDIDVIGHTDSTGPEDYNQQLSERRAAAVRDYIVNEKGVDGSIIDVSGKGETSPIADNSTAEGRAQNRRVEVNVGVQKPK
jgi:OmpA-OmpF porin, OOP family